MDVEEAVDLPKHFSSYRFWYLPTNFDLYFAGVVRGEAPVGSRTAVLPSDAAVEDIRRLMPLPHRLLRLPLRVASRFTRDDEKYQRLILPYWLGLLRVYGALQRRFPEAPSVAYRGQG